MKNILITGATGIIGIKHIFFEICSHIKIQHFLTVIAACTCLVCCTRAKNPDSSCFPEVSEPEALTRGPNEHLFASYYGINSWSRNQRFATVLETTLKDTIPTLKDAATLGMVDMETGEFIPLATTRAWNFQQGCMAHWLGTSPDSLIIYNDLENGLFVSIILNVHTKSRVKTLPFPVSAVSPDGKKAVSINFSRLRITRPDYGYDGEGQASRKEIPFPEDDGLYLADLETGKMDLLVALSEVKTMVAAVPPGGMEYFNHTLFNRDGSKIFWLARATPVRNTVSMCVNSDGSNLLACFPEGWGGSHFDWLNGEELMVTAKYEGKVDSHILVTPGKEDYKRLGKGILDYDGHGTFSPNGKWMITDTYPGAGLQEQKLYLMNMETEAILPLGRYVEPLEFRQKTGGSRCDLHPRWSPDGTLIGFNSTYTGSRQCYVVRLNL